MASNVQIDNNPLFEPVIAPGDIDVPALRRRITVSMLNIVKAEERAAPSAAKVLCEMYGLMAPKLHQVEMKDAAEEIGVSRRELERVLGIAKGDRGHNGN